MKASGDLPAISRSETAFQIADLRIDANACEIVGPGGRERLDAKVMDVFAMLARQAGQVVLREDLLAELWPNVVVTDEVLSRCIHVLRGQLSRAGGNERYRKMIETVPKRGYRLNTGVTSTALEAGVAPAVSSNRRALPLAGAIALGILLVVVALQLADRSPVMPTATADTQSIAVLPFLDMSENQDKRHYSDGIAEEILNRLAQARDLRVISRTSSFSFSDRPLDIPEIAAKLGVSHVLEGSLRWSGNRVRVTAQLIDTASDSHAWSASYDRTDDDLFGIQDEIAAEVAAALNVTFAHASRGPPTAVSAAALERFLQGRYFYYRRAAGDLERSVEYFEEAVAIDPRYARAWAALAGAYSALAWKDLPPDKALIAKQGEAARLAVESDPYLATAHASLSQFYFETRDAQKGEAYLRKAAALDPEEPMVMNHMIEDAVERGDMEAAIGLQRQAVAQDPLSAIIRNNLAVFLAAAAHLDEALSEYRKVREIDPGAGIESGIQLDMEMARVLVLQQRYEEAWALVAQIPPGTYRDHAVALLHAVPEHRAEADAALLRLVATTESIGDSVRLAETYAYRGMNDEALATLEERLVELRGDVETQDMSTWSLRFESRLSPFLKPLHADPRWARFLAQDG